MISVIKSALRKQKTPTIPASLFYSKDGYSVGSVDLDLILAEDHSFGSTISSHPVENGSVISDHIQTQLRHGSLRALVSCFSIRHSGSSADATFEDLESQEDSAEGIHAEMVASNRAKKAWDDLKAIWKARKTITIVCVLETYENVAISNCSTFMDGDNGDALEFSIEFQEIETVRLKEDKITAQVQPAAMKTTKQRRAAVGTNSGQKVGSTTNSAGESYSINSVLVKFGVN